MTHEDREFFGLLAMILGPLFIFAGWLSVVGQYGPVLMVVGALQLAAALHDFVSPIGLLIGGRAAGRHELADGPANRRPVGRVALHRSHPEIGVEHANAHI